MVNGNDHVQVKFECKEVNPRENSRAVYISPHNSGTVIDSEMSLINANNKLTTGFPMSHQPRSRVTPNFPKIGFRYPNLSFFCRNFDLKPLKLCYKVSLSENFRQQSCKDVEQSTTGRIIPTFWQGMTPFP